jgi:DNA polymerase-3 subunit gamma/tau
MNADSMFVLTLTLFKMIEALKVKDIDSYIESLESEIKDIDKNIKPLPKKEPIKKSQFEILIDRVTTLDESLGRCFSENIEFISFENSVLTWDSKASGDCKSMLKRHYNSILQFVKEVYGIETRIKLPYKKENQEKREEAKPTDIVISNEVLDIAQTPFIKRAEELFRASKITVKNIVD